MPLFTRRRRRLEAALEDAVNSCEHARLLLERAVERREYIPSSARRRLEESALALAEAPRIWGIPTPLREQAPHMAATMAGWQDRLDQHNVEHEQRELQALGSWLVSRGEDLTEAQKKAVVRDDKANLVVAAAGSGKTAVLVHRAAYLVRKRFPPERILAVTFGKDAAEEMERRLEREFGIRGVEVRTFHALGNQFVRKARGYVPDVIGEQAFRDFIRGAIQRATEQDNAFRDDLLSFLSQPDGATVPQEVDFATQADFYRAMRAARYTTLRGERVKSLAEKQIADFLTLHGVSYTYEAVHSPGRKGKAAYRPDFTLRNGICIEHWAIRHRGQQLPAWFEWTTEQYLQKMAWARRQFQAGSLVETYGDEFGNGTLLPLLRQRLTKAGLALRALPYRELVRKTYDFHQFERNVVKQFQQWITNAKSLGLKPADIPARLRGLSPRTQAFGRCGIRLLQDYTDHLARNKMVDFTDMTQDAVAYLRQNPMEAGTRYDHILVDEFQDASKDRVDLLHGLLGGGAHLFCVGDDWQSIYSFAGADVRFFRDFEAWFGSATVTVLEDCWRCPGGVVEAGNRLMGFNPGQILKRVVARSSRQDAPTIRELADGTDYRTAIVWHARLWVHSKLDSGCRPDHLMVLCRYNAPLSLLTDALQNDGIRVNLKGGIDLKTIHSAKGMQAEHVFLMDVSEPGFPSENEGPAVLEPVRIGPMAPLEEERRLFYVALTRAKQTLEIQTCATRKSRFLHEIEPEAKRRSVPTFIRDARPQIATANRLH